VIWAFSFPLIKYFLSGSVDNYFAILFRFLLAFAVFLPFIEWKATPKGLVLSLMGVGALQIGVMYIFYYNSFLYISAAEVALFTIFTPFYVTLIYDICNKRFRALYLISVSIAVFGAYIIRAGSVDNDFLMGFLFVQGANICFGAGQSLYKFVIESYKPYLQDNLLEKKLSQVNIFGFFYLGAIVVGALGFLFFGDDSKIPAFSLESIQWIVLIYLGLIASGVGYFLWNRGVCMCDSGVVAIMNNAIIPLAVVVDLIFPLFLGAEISNRAFLPLVIGGGIIGVSLWLHYMIIRFYEKHLKS